MPFLHVSHVSVISRWSICLYLNPVLCHKSVCVCDYIYINALIFAIQATMTWKRQTKFLTKFKQDVYISAKPGCFKGSLLDQTTWKELPAENCVTWSTSDEYKLLNYTQMKPAETLYIFASEMGKTFRLPEAKLL